ncbi:hypothetical protein [Candidatus Chromulinivorax destructor]|uniref:Uncharacterized protein n=1 Tax=Candidatus Chromulinivorax destructor TaxID=2066483 RepID=A0A345ZBY8_9BACT|nr:hypothetical protein [Candidatus Chromulinivorax destructor]AXK60805.1 hypothetical protein C0J27_03595 [Candidatus Chromulinivorax destructor]
MNKKIIGSILTILCSNNITFFAMERAPEQHTIDVSKKQRESLPDHKATETKNADLQNAHKHTHESTASESTRNSTSQSNLPEATNLSPSAHDIRSFQIDPTEPIQAVQPEPIQAIRIDEAFDPYNVQSVETGQQAPFDLFTSTESFSTKVADYNARRTGQADPIKSAKALIKMNETFTKITEGDAIENMSDVQILKLTEYKEKLDLLQKQWMVDPTQIKSADLAQFLNDFKDFSTEQMNLYTEKSLNRSSWQKMIDAIQDFFDVAFGYDKQATVVAEPIKEELLPSQIKDNATQESLFS